MNVLIFLRRLACRELNCLYSLRVYSTAFDPIAPEEFCDCSSCRNTGIQPIPLSEIL